MFQYAPTVDDRSGEILAGGQLGAAQANAMMLQQLGSDISKPIRTAGRAVAGFAMGGPAGAAMAMGGEGGGGGGGDDSMLGSIMSAYADRKQLEAKASSYDDIGRILNSAMFKDNPEAADAFGNLQKEKDPRKKVMGYEQLFSLVGPMSNMLMAQGRNRISEQGQFIQQTAPLIRAGATNAAAVTNQGGPSIMGATRRIGAPTGP